MTAKLPQSSSSWACYLVFKDRAVVTLTAFCYRCRFSAGSPQQPGAILLFEAVRLVNFALPLSSSSLQNPPSGFVLPFRGGARLLLRPRAPCQPVSVFSSTTAYRHLYFRPSSVQRRTASRLSSVGGAASTSSPRPPSTATGDLFKLSVPSSYFPVRLFR